MCHLADYFLEGSNRDLLTEGKIRILFNAEQMPLRGHPDIPSIFDHVKNERDRRSPHASLLSGTEFGRPYDFHTASYRSFGGRSAEHLPRRSYGEDAEFLAAAEKQKLDMTYIPPDAMEKQVEALYALPKDILDRADLR